MTVQELAGSLGLKPYCMPDPDRPVLGIYAGDLLSWVLGRAAAGEAWLTVMTNQYVASVASVTEVSCVILTEGVVPDEDLLHRAQLHDVNLLGTPLTTFEAAAAMGTLAMGRRTNATAS